MPSPGGSRVDDGCSVHLLVGCSGGGNGDGTAGGGGNGDGGEGGGEGGRGGLQQTPSYGEPLASQDISQYRSLRQVDEWLHRLA